MLASRLVPLLIAVTLLASACATAPSTPTEDAMSQDMSAMDDDMPHGGMDEHMQGDMDQHMAGDHAHEDIVYPPREGAREIVITMIDLAFEPDRLTLSAGETVNLLRSSVHRRRPC